MRLIAFLRSTLTTDAAAGRMLAAEIDEEFSHHLQETERKLVEVGVDDAEARRQALARFGNPEGHRAACIRIAREELFMIHKLITAGLLITTLLLAFASFRLYRIGREATNEAHVNMDRALHERERAVAVTDFLTSILTSADVVGADGPSVAELLDKASLEADRSLADQPEVAARIRDAVEEARQRAVSESAADDVDD